VARSPAPLPTTRGKKQKQVNKVMEGDGMYPHKQRVMRALDVKREAGGVFRTRPKDSTDVESANRVPARLYGHSPLNPVSVPEKEGLTVLI
jgi:hypothetical protein